jgi:hypothetical protein
MRPKAEALGYPFCGIPEALGYPFCGIPEALGYPFCGIPEALGYPICGIPEALGYPICGNMAGRDNARSLQSCEAGGEGFNGVGGGEEEPVEGGVDPRL